MKINEVIDMSNMFKDCRALVGINTNTRNPSETTYDFVVNEKTITFKMYEVHRMKQENPDFTFENKHISRLRDECTQLMLDKYPEDLL